MKLIHGKNCSLKTPKPKLRKGSFSTVDREWIGYIDLSNTFIIIFILK